MSCKNLLVTVRSLSQMFMSHILYVHACLSCVFIYWQYTNQFMYRRVTGLFTTTNNWPKGFCKWLWKNSTVNSAIQQWWNRRGKKKSHFLFFFSCYLSPHYVCFQQENALRHYSLALLCLNTLQQSKRWMILDCFGNNVPLINMSCLFCQCALYCLAEQV